MSDLDDTAVKGWEGKRTAIDVIGDVHGHAGELEALLHSMGYRKDLPGRVGVYAHPGRLAVFVGDLIDRGPRIWDTLCIVARMHRAGTAACILGNHEWNALAWSVRRPDGKGFLRDHSHPRWRQHKATLDQLSAPQLAEALDWFRALSFGLVFFDCRVVHAAWDPRAIVEIERAVERHDGLTDDFLVEAHTEGTSLKCAVDMTLKGPEMPLPEEVDLVDSDGHRQTSVRVRWFEPPAGKNLQSWSMPPRNDLPELPLEPSRIPDTPGYPETAPILFFGHYSCRGDAPIPYAPNLVCVDWSVASGGQLAAYRFDGERVADYRKIRAMRRENGRYREIEWLAS